MNIFSVDNYGLYRALKANPYSYVDVRGEDEQPIHDGGDGVKRNDVAFVITHATGQYDKSYKAVQINRLLNFGVRYRLLPKNIYHLLACNYPTECDNVNGICKGDDILSYLFIEDGENKVFSHDGSLFEGYNDDVFDNLPNTVISIGGNFDQCLRRTLKEIGRGMYNQGKNTFNIILPVEYIYKQDDNISESLFDILSRQSKEFQKRFLISQFAITFNGPTNNRKKIGNGQILFQRYR